MNITLRPAEQKDITFLWYLRNRPDVHCYFRTPKPVIWEEHVQWIMPRVLGLNATQLYIVEADGVSAGQIRCDYNEERTEAEVSISLLEEFRSKGIAKEALRQIIEIKKVRGLKLLVAEIHKENNASEQLFIKAGFNYVGEEGLYRRYNLLLAPSAV